MEQLAQTPKDLLGLDSKTPNAGTAAMGPVLFEYAFSSIHEKEHAKPGQAFLSLVVLYGALKLKGTAPVNLTDVATVRAFYPVAKEMVTEILKENQVVLNALIDEHEEAHNGSKRN